MMIKRTTKDPSAWNVPYPKAGTIYKIEFYLVQNLGPRNGPGYYVVSKGNYNNNIDNNNNNNNNDNNSFL